ncbi:NADH pyrophosphatase [bacterium BMS3Bbin12]|nr:NADH pyrophosphatase [bacterium BMS3Abin12]GBE48203.1 NADH pyrophosphatase [bacterium BMS3Bbin12]GBE50441.1 NADH pyrophosphatase [bacterium BMS3Bbin13]
MKYCSHCAHPVVLRIPPGDGRPRYVCDHCQTIHYQNPKIVAGCIPEWEDRILLCRRAIEPRYGLWTVPAGFMENGETVAGAAARETLEETCAEVDSCRLYALFNLPHISQVYLLFRGRLSAPRFAPGAESLEVELFTERAIPWDRLAFPVIRETLRRYFADRRTGTFPVHTGDLLPEGVVADRTGPAGITAHE